MRGDSVTIMGVSTAVPVGTPKRGKKVSKMKERKEFGADKVIEKNKHVIRFKKKIQMMLQSTAAGGGGVQPSLLLLLFWRGLRVL